MTAQGPLDDLTTCVCSPRLTSDCVPRYSAQHHHPLTGCSSVRDYSSAEKRLHSEPPEPALPTPQSHHLHPAAKPKKPRARPSSLQVFPFLPQQAAKSQARDSLHDPHHDPFHDSRHSSFPQAQPHKPPYSPTHAALHRSRCGSDSPETLSALPAQPNPAETQSSPACLPSTSRSASRSRAPATASLTQ